MINLRTVIIAIALTLQATALFAEDEKKPVVLSEKDPIIMDHGGTPHRVPAHRADVPDVYYNDVTYVMQFEGESSMCNIPYNVYNENQDLVYSGVIVFDEEGCYSVDLSFLLVGMYTIELTIGNDVYVGEFEVQ